LADHFNREWRHAKKHDKDVRENPRAMTKLRLQANKVKHVLSANMEIPVYMDALHDDMSLSVHITRSQMEEFCADLMVRAVVPVTKVLTMANVTLQNITAIELIGGGMRVPKIQTELSKALGNLEMGLHINSDESMALGASFFGANISTAFRVRHVGLTDVNPFTVAVSLQNMPEEEKKGLLGFGGGSKKMPEGEAEEEWTKRATMFKSFGKMGVKKTIAFTHAKDVHCALDYEENEHLPKGTQ
jgi:hypoxia up-regulated 1